MRYSPTISTKKAIFLAIQTQETTNYTHVKPKYIYNKKNVSSIISQGRYVEGDVYAALPPTL